MMTSLFESRILKYILVNIHNKRMKRIRYLFLKCSKHVLIFQFFRLGIVLWLGHIIHEIISCNSHSRKYLSIEWQEKAYLKSSCVLNIGHDTRSSTCFNHTACCVYNISYDGSKYLRTIFVGSRVSRECTCTCTCTRVHVAHDEIIRRWRWRGRILSSGEITTPAIKNIANYIRSRNSQEAETRISRALTYYSRPPCANCNNGRFGCWRVNKCRDYRILIFRMLFIRKHARVYFNIVSILICRAELLYKQPRDIPFTVLTSLL